MQKCGMNLDEWNSFETKIQVNRDLIKAISVRSNNLTTIEKGSAE